MFSCLFPVFLVTFHWLQPIKNEVFVLDVLTWLSETIAVISSTPRSSARLNTTPPAHCHPTQPASKPPTPWPNLTPTKTRAKSSLPDKKKKMVAFALLCYTNCPPRIHTKPLIFCRVGWIQDHLHIQFSLNNVDKENIPLWFWLQFSWLVDISLVKQGICVSLSVGVPLETHTVWKLNASPMLLGIQPQWPQPPQPLS